MEERSMDTLLGSAVFVLMSLSVMSAGVFVVVWG
jgi:hypothetical protein